MNSYRAFLQRVMAYTSILACVSSPAGANDYTRAGVEGFSRLTSPYNSVGGGLVTAFDYTNQSSLLYDKAQGSQLRRYMAVNVAPVRWFEVGFQYSAIDTAMEMVEPAGIVAHGDLMISPKVSWRVGDWTLGLLGQAKHYYGHGQKAYALHGLAARSFSAWTVLAEAGWNMERHVATEASPSPLRAFAWQKPGLNFLFLGIGASRDFDWGEPVVEYLTHQYVGPAVSSGSSPHFFVAGVRLRTILSGLVAKPEVVLATFGEPTDHIPFEPLWRAGLALTYEVPAARMLDELFPPPGKLVLVVTDAAGLPVTEATAFIGGMRLRPDAYGYIEQELKAGSYVVRVDAPRFVSKTQALAVKASSRTEKRFRLEKNTGVVSGWIYLSGIRGDANINIDGLERSFQTERGRFEAELPPGPYSMEVSAPGYLPAKKKFMIRRGEEVTFNTINLSRLATAIEVDLASTQAEKPKSSVSASTAATVSAPITSSASRPEAEPAAKVATQPVDEHPVDNQAVVEIEPVSNDVKAWLEADIPDGAEPFDSPVFFEFGEWTIDIAAYPALDRLAEFLKSDRTVKQLIIEGRADSIGPQDVNLVIAEKRAEAVYAYLTRHGVSRERLATTKTVYERKPSSQTVDLRASDRRVGFRIER